MIEGKKLEECRAKLELHLKDRLAEYKAKKEKFSSVECLAMRVEFFQQHPQYEDCDMWLRAIWDTENTSPGHAKVKGVSVVALEKSYYSGTAQGDAV
jgi:hypothetical protein